MPPPSITRRLACASIAGALARPALGAATPVIRVVTEESPPYNMTQGGHLTGMCTEIVRAVMAEAGVSATIEVMPWARAYSLALHDPNVLIYSMYRTAARAQLFKWVGMVAQAHSSLFALASRQLVLHQLDDAKRYQIGTVNDDAGEQYLLSRGFQLGRNLQSSNSYETNYEKLKLGRIDIWVSDDGNARYLEKQADPPPSLRMARLLTLPDLDSSGGLNMAFSRPTPDAIVDRFRKGLDAVRHDGRYDEITRRWIG